MTTVGLRQQGSQAVGPGSSLRRAKYFSNFADICQKFHFNGSHGTVWVGQQGSESVGPGSSLSCQKL